MSLGSAYTIPNATITNLMLGGSIALSYLVSGGAFQMIIFNGSGVPTYASLSLNNLSSGLINQFIQSNGSSNNWITMSGDATLLAGVLTIAAGSFTNDKLLNNSISLNGQVMSLGSTAYTIPNQSIIPSMHSYSIKCGISIRFNISNLKYFNYTSRNELLFKCVNYNITE